jgi:YD repeat-containing protein
MFDPLNHQTTFVPHDGELPGAVTNPLNTTTQFGHDLGALVSVPTPLGHTETRFVDQAGRLVQVADPGGSMTRFEYNPHDQVTKIVDPLAGETTFTFLDPRGAPPPLARTRRLRASCGPQALDGNGNLLTLTDARSKTTIWTYDETALSPHGARAERVAECELAGVGPRER